MRCQKPVMNLSVDRQLAFPYHQIVQILVVEDERKLALAIQQGLEAQHHTVAIACTGEEGFYAAHVSRFDLIILDVMLPGRDGIEILRTLRQEGLQTPVLLLTAKDSVEDRVRGLDGGADDYLVKPFAFPELLARVRALVRRGKAEVDETLGLADLHLDLARHVATRAGHELELTSREFDLLEYLMRNGGRVVSREMLARHVWQITVPSTALDNVIDVQIGRLRRKLDDRFELKLLHTVRGVGFTLRDTAAVG
jgi:two-component system copper resistance phosphate regulon response regulator CusR